MSLVLQIVLYNIRPSLLSVKDLINIQCVSRDYHGVALDYIEHLFKTYKSSTTEQGCEVSFDPLEKKPLCKKCGAHCGKYNPFIMEHRCVDCFNSLITKTDAKKKYRLLDDDLQPLNYILKYIAAYKKYGVLYWPPDVIGIAMIKHKRATYSSLMDFLQGICCSNPILEITRHISTQCTTALS